MNGIATRAWASGIRRIDVRRSSGGESSATRNPKPIVTADVPRGSIRSASNARAGPVAPVGDRRRRQHPERERDRGRRHPEEERVADRVDRRDEERPAPPDGPERPPRGEPVPVLRGEGPLHEDGEGEPEEERDEAQVRRQEEALAPGSGGPADIRGGAEAEAPLGRAGEATVDGEERHDGGRAGGGSGPPRPGG